MVDGIQLLQDHLGSRRRWRPSVVDPIDIDPPFGLLAHLLNISEWLA
jgi:hypothetical protein